MAITNNYKGFAPVTPTELASKDADPDFGGNLNRSVQELNKNYAIDATITNSYTEGFVNQFGASSQYSTNEQRFVQSMIQESININGITVRYMPRNGLYTDSVWNERPESTFDRGLQLPMLLVSTAGFEGEGDVMTQYGLEFREEVILSLAIPKFEDLYRLYESDLDIEKKALYNRTRPLEGDLIVIPFGRTANNTNQYTPKFFEITRVTTYQDGAFFQMGDNYQYKIRARLFELSGEDLNFAPTVTKTDLDGKTKILADSDTGKIAEAKQLYDTIDSDTGRHDIAKDSDTISDIYADNHELEKYSQEHVVYDNKGEALKEKPRTITKDYTAKAFGYPSVISNLDDI